MAQLKDLLVLGPTKLNGDIYIRNSSIVDGHLILEPINSPEGGQITLAPPTNNTTLSGIILDTNDGNLRIFGQESQDKETVAGYGSILTINPYKQTISGAIGQPYSTTNIKVPYSDITDAITLTIKDTTDASIIKAKPFIDSITVDDHTITVSRKSISQIGLSTTYRYKGSVTSINDLYNINSAEIGDVYNINMSRDQWNNELQGTNWACKKKVTTATNNTNYNEYWEQIGNTIVLSGYVELAGNNTLTGQNTFNNKNTFSNDNTFSGQNMFTNNNTFNGINTFTHVSVSNKNACINKQSAINFIGDETLGVLGWLSGKTYGGFISLSTDTSGTNKSNKLSIGYMNNGSSGNSFKNLMTWDGDSGRLNTKILQIDSNVDFQYHETDKCIDVIFN